MTEPSEHCHWTLDSQTCHTADSDSRRKHFCFCQMLLFVVELICSISVLLYILLLWTQFQLSCYFGIFSVRAKTIRQAEPWLPSETWWKCGLLNWNGGMRSSRISLIVDLIHLNCGSSSWLKSPLCFRISCGWQRFSLEIYIAACLVNESTVKFSCRPVTVQQCFQSVAELY